MPFTIALVNPDVVAHTTIPEGNMWRHGLYEVPSHLYSYRDPGDEQTSTQSEVHMSNMDDVWNYDELDGAVATAFAVYGRIMYQNHDCEATHEETHHEEIARMLCEWAVAHPEGLWVTG